VKKSTSLKTITCAAFCFTTFYYAYGQETGSFKTSDNEILYFTKYGQGPKVVLLYGGPGYAVSSMKFWADSLSADYQVILFDQRGTGLSNKVKFDTASINLTSAVRDIDELRKYLKEEKLTLAGISWGGMLAQAYAAFYPDNTEKIVLVSTLGPDLSLMSAFTDNMNMRRFPEETDSLNYWNKQPDGDRAKIKRSFYEYLPEFYDHHTGKKMLTIFFATTKYYPEMGDLMWKDLINSYDLKTRLKDYQGECIVIRPRQDPVPAEAVFQIKELLPQTEIFTIEKCGHFPDYEKPAEFFIILKKVLP
jgi:proline iminopeptidase